MFVRWTKGALDTLDQAIDYVANRTPDAAAIAAQKIWDAAQVLSEHPGLGRPGRVEGTRELVISGLPYVLPYVVRDDNIVILRVMHTARRWPKSFDDD